MIIYEVNLEIETDIFTNYQTWLQQHLQEMLSFPGFETAAVYQLESEASAAKKLVVHYQVNSKDNLQLYFDQHAPAMREDGIKRFGTKFSANRRILEELNT